ncbi:class A beta-lactamase [Stakelama pacifica]|uniref:beta-lactamase n=1 Tax=Stakelama pacifica TaxID=517720 RepID=A0A4R6FF27_9SPHN|nr:class A beta-lactamase [Stakelama pacifica]TDN79886.1 beta-lactamase class A [Stakelama pacifica]GGO98113.1 beta-lactamase [Stakelama pacifica]
MDFTRRSMLAGATALGLVATTRGATAFQAAQGGSIFDKLENAVNGKLYLAVLDTGTGHRLTWNADQRVGLCSTFKLPLAAAVMAGAEKGTLSLDTPVSISAADLLDYAPAVKANLAKGSMTIGELARAAVTVSDNSAANLLLPQVGGPRGLTRYLREAGDTVTSIDHPEPLINRVRPGQDADSTTPWAMAGLVNDLLFSQLLTEAHRRTLAQWMIDSETGLKRIRAGLPVNWKAGDKTGTSGDGWYNDVAVAWPGEGRRPIVIASYLWAPDGQPDAADAVHAKIGELVGALFAP